MPGLVPGIRIRMALPCILDRDGRAKPGHDGVGTYNLISPRFTLAPRFASTVFDRPPA